VSDVAVSERSERTEERTLVSDVFSFSLKGFLHVSDAGNLLPCTCKEKGLKRNIYKVIKTKN